jgi:hypothetical protein
MAGGREGGREAYGRGGGEREGGRDADGHGGKEGGRDAHYGETIAQVKRVFIITFDVIRVGKHVNNRIILMLTARRFHISD